MPSVTQGFGLFLILLGGSAYGLTGAQSLTALIPSFFGIPILLSGWLAGRPNSRRSLWMHIAVSLAALGLLGTARGVVGFVGMLAGNDAARPAAVVVQAVMALACAAFVAVAVRSFINARRAEVSS